MTRHIIDACLQHGAHLVYFDNVYQNAPPYVFDSSRYETTFSVTPTPDGIAQTLHSIRG